MEFLIGHAEGRVSDQAMERLRAAVREAKKETAIHLEWLRRLTKSSIDDFHMGKEKFARLLKIRGFSYTPEDILEIARKHLAEMKSEKVRIAKRMSKAGTLEAAYEVVRKDTAKDFDGVMTETRQIVNAAKKFVEERDLATLDPEAVLKIIETPDFMVDTIPTAVTDMPAPFEEVSTGLYVQTRPRTEEELRGVWNHAMIVNTAVH